MSDENGEKPLQDYLEILAETALNSHVDKVKYLFIMKALEYLATVPKKILPSNNSVEETPTTTTLEVKVDKQTYSQTFRLVKALRRSPIFELRLSIANFNWHFRIIFFPKYHENKLYYCLTFPFEKRKSDVDPTDEFRDRAYDIFKSLQTQGTQFNP
ncbi:hypothetical protein EV213_108210 [Aureibacillus halotolerans]|uniref:Uncharacterized protein n=2 Tax=Aureibacillus halotolerans TaxID=1508390 RepID=A0A4R6TZ48_9BACI|nr:hypothetical protein EV213_108210 [Aureibacillus halotolerans]